ncbi:MAG TPA: 2-polyprenyl-3-methyl-6-methoxy-1,4-benzoquinone monooxygenase [Woeseiaceae bacterium]|nr:2-polyprenyl-3-methyl-6-methoxy-1,4-benzoquinone monooxygenase [Woeseiaceae bacterium]|tara:strand:- start:17069 stop:17713 length:645 start_codon:yes stop_codon:yes gene_type:complete
MKQKINDPIDRFFSSVDQIRLLIESNRTKNYRPNPAEDTSEIDLTDDEKAHAAGLMRVNHAGEIAAQGLYQGHAVFSKDLKIKKQMDNAANEELDHLNWCRERVEELGEKTSKLGPIWYAGSFVIGAASGFFGDKWSLGFIEETEKQVSEHLTKHLNLLPEKDQRSRKIVTQMRIEEEGHGENAKNAGAEELPKFIRNAMKITSKIMTKTAYYF